MSKFKVGDRVRVVRDPYRDVSLNNDLTGREGTVVVTVTPPRWGPSDPVSATAPIWVRVDFVGVTVILHPDELEVIEP